MARSSQPDDAVALITPEADGWRLSVDGGAAQQVASLDVAASLIPTDSFIHLALPGRLVLLERLKFPSTDREELAGMLQLQLEKTLPYPIDEVSSDFEVISHADSESTLLSVAANATQLDELCQPMRTRERLPQKITLYAMHVAASCPADQIVLCLWPEEGHLEVAICERGKLSYALSIASTDAEALLAELPQMVLSAEMEGVPTDFANIRLEKSCAHLRDVLADYFEDPVELVSLNTALPVPPGNLLPPSWQAEAKRLQRASRLRSRLQLGAVLWLLLIAAAFIYLAWLKRQVQKIDAQFVIAQPQLEFVQSRMARWQTLAPAIDPHRYTIEVLLGVYNSRPSDEVKITVFEHTPGQFRVEGEAPSANLVIEFLDKLRAESSLSTFRIDSPPPSILPTGSAHFNVFGKL